MLAGEGEDLRGLPVSLRKVSLAQLLSREVDGIFIAEYEQGDMGDVLFRVACRMGFAGIVLSTSIAPMAPADPSIGLRC
jgi:bifunctional non-homologous end joining protein LigD